MNEPDTEVHLLVPGLLVPTNEPLTLPPTPGIDRLLSRGEAEECAGTDYASTLFHLFGVVAPAGRDLPTAAVSRIGAGADADDACWFHAAPVYLRPDMDRLLLFDGRSLDIHADEAKALAARIESHFSNEQWRVEPVSPDRWFLRLPRMPAIRTHPLDAVAGRSMFPFLPEGEEAVNWHSYLNEIQMLFFHSEVNEARRADGRGEIGGLWLWGGGVRPEVGPAQWCRVGGDDPLLRGLARVAQVMLEPLEDPSRNAAGPRLEVRPQLQDALLDQDPDAWAGELKKLDAFASDLIRSINSSRIGQLLLYPCNGQRYVVTKSHLRRFWRRSRPLSGRLGYP